MKMSTIFGELEVRPRPKNAPASPIRRNKDFQVRPKSALVEVNGVMTTPELVQGLVSRD